MIKRFWLWIITIFKKEKKVPKVKQKKQRSKQVKFTKHAKERLRERHGIVLTSKMVSSIGKDIISKTAKLSQINRDGTETLVVIYNDIKYKLIYEPISYYIITIYPSIKKKKKKPISRSKNLREYRQRMKFYDGSRKVERNVFKKPYKRNKIVEYNESE